MHRIAIAMALSFRPALFGVGGLLVMIGLAAGFMAAGMLEQADDLSSSLSAGVTSSFFALFSGVLVGTGASLIAAGGLVSAKTRATQSGIPAALCIASIILASIFLGKPSTFGFPMLLAFISAAVFACGMLVQTLLFYFTGAGKAISGPAGKKR